MKRLQSLELASLFCLLTAGCTSSGGQNGTGGTTQGTGGTTQGTGGTTQGTGGTTQGTGGTTQGTGGTTQGTGGTTQGTGGTTQGTGGAGGKGGASSGGAGGSGSGGKAGAGGSATGGGTGGGAGTAGSGPGTGGSGIGGAVSEPQVVTSADGAYWQTGTLTEVTSGTADVTVNDGTASQTWEGFGGAFNEMGWTALSTLSDSDKATAIDLLFGADAARFAMGRIPMGATDYSTDRYTLDETANDTKMQNFSISRDLQKLIPYVKAALAVNPNIRFWSSPWTPPTWMKSPVGFDGGNMKSDDATLTAYALYFVDFVQQYAQQGITIEAVAPQNEPNYAQGYPSCLWATSLFTTFVGKYLGPTLATASPSTKIMLGTMSNSSADPAIVSSVMGDATAKKYIKVLGYQWGMQASVSAAKSYGLPIWQTEHKCGNCPFSGTSDCSTHANGKGVKAPNDYAYGVETWDLISNWIRDGVTAYSAWNMVLDTGGLGIDTTRDWNQNALLAIDTTAKKLIVTPAYYVFRHFSQFVDPGAKVVATSGGDAVGFKNPDGTIVAVMYNSGAAKKAIVTVAGKKMQFDMPAKGWATVNYK